MRGFLSFVVGACFVVFASIVVVPGTVSQPHPAGLGGIHVVLVPAGDDPGGH